MQIKLSAGGSFVAAEQVEATAKREGLDQATTAEIASDYEDAQISALKLGFLVAALLVLASLFTTRQLPTKLFSEPAASGST